MHSWIFRECSCCTLFYGYFLEFIFKKMNGQMPTMFLSCDAERNVDHFISDVSCLCNWPQAGGQAISSSY